MKTILSTTFIVLLLGAMPCLAQDQEKPKPDGSSTDFPDEPDSSAPINETSEKESRLLSQTLGGTQFAADVTLMEGVDPLFPFRKKPTAWDPFAPRPLPVNHDKMKPLLPDPLEIFMRPIRNSEAWTQDNLGLSWNIYYTLLYQYATRTVRKQPPPDPNEYYGRSAGTGRLDLNLNWNIFDVPDIAHGQIGVLMRSGVVIGQPGDYQAGAAIGSIPVNPDALYWGNNTSLCLAYWQQGFGNDNFVITAGKIHPNQYIALSRIANDESTQFISGVFDGLNTLGPNLGNYAPGIAMQWVPAGGFYCNGVIVDAQGGPNTGFNSVGNGNWWMAGQIGWVPKFKNANGDELVGNWAVFAALTNYGVVDSKSLSLTALAPGVIPPPQPVVQTQFIGNSLTLGPGVQAGEADGYGFGLMIEQQITPEISVLAEYGLSNNDLSPVREAMNLVAGFTSPFGRNDDMIGVGLNWTVPSDLYKNSRREEVMMEMFYRVQITASMQLSPDVQILFRPATGEDRPVAVFGVRLRTQF